MSREDIKALIDRLIAMSDEREIKKLNLFVALLLDKELNKKAREEAAKQGIPFYEYANNEIEKALSEAEQKNQQGGS